MKNVHCIGSDFLNVPGLKVLNDDNVVIYIVSMNNHNELELEQYGHYNVPLTFNDLETIMNSWHNMMERKSMLEG